MRAWNESGARVRLVPTTRRKAKLLIRTHASANIGQAAWIGWVPPSLRVVDYLSRRRVPTGHNFVWIAPKRDPSEGGYTREVYARVAAHEIGHTLGLAHVRGCALMATDTWTACNQGNGDQWRCRLLEPDDVRGLVRLYGGRANPVRADPFCDPEGL